MVKAMAFILFLAVICTCVFLCRKYSGYIGNKIYKTVEDIFFGDLRRLK